MDRQTAADIFARYRSGNCTEAERQLVEGWILHGARSPLDLTDAELLEDLTDIRSGLERGLRRVKPKTFRIRRWFPYAAALIFAAATVGIFVWEYGQRNKAQETTQVDVLPGGNRAMLTLADGHTVDLSEAQTGIIMGDEIRYADGSTVLNPEAGKPGSPENGPQYAILTTPKGGTYQIVLPDGTKVWLNSASRLRYPIRFRGDERIVELKGEAYFEVASLPVRSSGKRNEKQPFLVKTQSQTVEVLGTRFNISAYTDENKVKTTLVEGSVRVILPALPTTTLKPGQQSVVQGAAINILNVDVSQYVAWKDGNFYFNNTPLFDMMKQIARWYDVDVVYENSVPRELFSGSMSRNVTLQTVLELLKISEINYRVEGKKIIIE